MEVFDLTQSPGLIRPAYLFDAAFIFAGLVLTVIALAVRDMKKAGKLDGSSRFVLSRGIDPLWAAMIGAPVCFLVAGGEAYHALSLRDAVVHGRYRTLEGCLESFAPGESACRKSGGGAELWMLVGRKFSYCNTSETVAYHATEAVGGIVHPTSRVRVSYVAGSFLGGNDIVRLETRPNLCPAAPPPPGGP